MITTITLERERERVREREGKAEQRDTKRRGGREGERETFVSHLVEEVHFPCALCGP